MKRENHEHSFEFIRVTTSAVSGGCSPIKVATVICTTCGMVAETPIKTY